MIKNNIERIIFVAMIGICLYSIVISGFREKEAYNTAGELQTEIALIENDNNILRNKIEVLEVDKQLLEDEIEELKDFKKTLPTASYIGEFEITYYCSCEKCCNKTDGITFTGTQATEGRTIAVDPEIIPLGSTVIIDGQTYIAEDIGGAVKDLRVDVFVNDHQTALNLGRTVKEVYLLEV